jgi:hypothetical protein
VRKLAPLFKKVRIAAHTNERAYEIHDYYTKLRLEDPSYNNVGVHICNVIDENHVEKFVSGSSYVINAVDVKKAVDEQESEVLIDGTGNIALNCYKTPSVKRLVHISVIGAGLYFFREFFILQKKHMMYKKELTT